MPRARLLLAGLLLAGCGDDGSMTMFDAGPLPPGTDAGPPLPGTDAGPPLPGTDAGPGGGDYSEPICDRTVDLSDLAAAYDGTNLRETLNGIATRRYPYGLAFIEAQSDDHIRTWYGGSSPATFDGPSTITMPNLLARWEVVVHEGAHIWDFSNRTGGMHPYRVRDDLVIRVRSIDTFARNEILTIHVDAASDTYDEVYLAGMSGTQGFDNLLDEYNAYAHSLASRYCVSDDLQEGRRTSARDGILTMMYYVSRYLKLARENHPDDYAEIIGDPGHVEVILTVWDRAEFWLDVTADRPELSVRGEQIEAWVYTDEVLSEIAMLRE